MKLTLTTLVDGEQPLYRLLEVKLPIKVAYRLSKLANKIKKELTVFYEQRLNLYKQYGECVDVVKDSWSIKPENISKFKEDLKQLSDEEVDIDIPPLSITDFGDIQIESSILSELAFILE